MGTLSWPKHDSGDAQREALKIFYDENNWLDNSVYISRLKAIIPGLGEEAYSKKIQIYTYFGFVTLDDRPRSPMKKITESGRKFYEARYINSNHQEIFEIIVNSLEQMTFGRNNRAVKSDVDVEPPQILLRCILALGHLTKPEFGFIIWSLLEKKPERENIFDIITLIATNRILNKNDYPELKTSTYKNYYSDPKWITALVDMNFLITNEDNGWKIKPDVIVLYADRLQKLKIFNNETSDGATSSEEGDENVILTNTALKQIIFESFKYVLSQYGEENILKENKIKDNSIEDRKYKGLSLNKYFGFETLLGLFDTEQIPENLKSSGTTRFINEKITILDNNNVYFTSQWNGNDNGRGLSLENFNKFLLDVSNNKIKIIIEDNLYKLVFISHSFILNQNSIFYGSPGTGKSHKADKITNGKDVQKVTFHPDYDYHSFVGGYKPTMDGDKIAYKFVPQIFTKIYVDAWKNLASADVTKPFYLQIEEINRGNCAEIFGDLFQLLDRKVDGSSKYEVTAEEELRKYLEDKDGFGTSEHEGIKGGKLRFPSNLKIIATMNTSDQSLFPMDSAFKRRWDWIYVPIDYKCSSSDFTIQLDNGKAFNWLEFLKNVNIEIFKIDNNQDKQIGNWFIDAQNSGKVISESTFVNKVVFYLWNDVFKDEEKTIFKLADGNNLTYTSFFENEASNNLVSYILEERLKLTDLNKSVPTTTGEE